MTTIEKIENYALIEIEESYEPTVQEFIDAVTSYIERYTGRVFAEPDEETEATDLVFDGTNGDEIFIDDAIEVTGVKIGDDELSSTDISGNGVDEFLDCRFVGFLNFNEGVVFDFLNSGHCLELNVGAWPFRVRICLFGIGTRLVGVIINGQNSQDIDNKEVQSETIGRYSVTYKSGSTQATDYVNAMKILKMYKRYA